MGLFKNMLEGLRPGSSINFQVAVNARRVKMEREGFRTDHINWEHYAKVLEAKRKQNEVLLDQMEGIA